MGKIFKLSKLYSFKSFITILVIGVISLLLLIVHIESKLPTVEILKDVQLQVPLKIYSADGKLLAEYGEKRRTPLTLQQIPKPLINAVIATEDRRFYKHPGVDIRGLLRAMLNLISKGTKEQGGSTITMQVARNFFLSRNKTYTRKLNEILLALKIEQELSKDEILELYLNKIYFGKRAYGVAAAAEVYYGTTVDKLTLAQMAMLAGLPQAPSVINPLNSPENAIKRRSHVLDRMLKYDFITKAEYEQAMQEPITTSYHGKIVELQAPYIAEMVRQHIVEMYGDSAYDHGYQVITTIDSNMQIAANNALSRAIIEYDQRHGYRGIIKTIPVYSRYLPELKEIPRVGNLVPAVIIEVKDQSVIALLKDNSKVTVNWNGLSWTKANAKTANEILAVGNVVYLAPTYNSQWTLAQVPQVEGAIVAMDPNNGAVKALAGGFDYERSSFNRAVQAERQPGSSFKPFIYAAALENNFTPASIFNDAPIVGDEPSNSDWRPQNHNKQFYGPTRLRTGLTYSRNLVSIRVLQSVGINKTIDMLSDLGLASLPRGLSLALGTNLLTPIELSTAYCVFPNGGHKIESFYIQKILDYQNNVIYTANPPTVGQKALIEAPRVLSPQTAYLMTSMLHDVVQHGTAKSALQLGRQDLAGKTGTTNDQFDGWFAGYNRDLVVTTWMGFDEPQSLKEYAGTTALPMWIYFMSSALRGKPNSVQPQPPGLVTVRIDPVTGLLARPGQTDAIYEMFVENTAPRTVASGKQQLGNASETSLADELDNIF